MLSLCTSLLYIGTPLKHYCFTLLYRGATFLALHTGTMFHVSCDTQRRRVFYGIQEWSCLLPVHTTVGLHTMGSMYTTYPASPSRSTSAQVAPGVQTGPHHTTSYSSAGPTSAPASPTKIDGKEFFRQARYRPSVLTLCSGGCSRCCWCHSPCLMSVGCSCL